MSARANGESGRDGDGVARAADERKAMLVVRRAGAGDVVPLGFFFDTMLRKDYFLRRGQLVELMHDKYHQVFVAEIDTVLVGAAITTCGSRLVNVLVHPAYRGLGIGRELLRVSGATEVRVKTDMSTGDPRPFYQSLGFIATGEINAKGNIEVLRLPQATNGAKRSNGVGANGAGRRLKGQNHGRCARTG